MNYNTNYIDIKRVSTMNNDEMDKKKARAAYMRQWRAKRKALAEKDPDFARKLEKEKEKTRKQNNKSQRRVTKKKKAKEKKDPDFAKQQKEKRRQYNITGGFIYALNNATLEDLLNMQEQIGQKIASLQQNTDEKK